MAQHCLLSHYVAFLELQVARRIDDDVRQVIALLADFIVVIARQVQRLHATPHKVANLSSLDLLCVIVARFVDHVDRILKVSHESETKARTIKSFSLLHLDHSVLHRKAQKYASDGGRNENKFDGKYFMSGCVFFSHFFGVKVEARFEKR